MYGQVFVICLQDVTGLAILRSFPEVLTYVRTGYLR